jgi:hypothetical protein
MLESWHNAALALPVLHPCAPTKKFDASYGMLFCCAGLLGYFRPSIPITAKDLEVRGMSGTAVLERLTGAGVLLLLCGFIACMHGDCAPHSSPDKVCVDGVWWDVGAVQKSFARCQKPRCHDKHPAFLSKAWHDLEACKPSPRGSSILLAPNQDTLPLEPDRILFISAVAACH